jgi:hypothetical protein
MGLGAVSQLTPNSRKAGPQEQAIEGFFFVVGTVWMGLHAGISLSSTRAKEFRKLYDFWGDAERHSRSLSIGWPKGHYCPKGYNNGQANVIAIRIRSCPRRLRSVWTDAASSLQEPPAMIRWQYEVYALTL